jgi:hypothetical protein
LSEQSSFFKEEFKEGGKGRNSSSIIYEGGDSDEESQSYQVDPNTYYRTQQLKMQGKRSSGVQG